MGDGKIDHNPCNCGSTKAPVHDMCINEELHDRVYCQECPAEVIDVDYETTRDAWNAINTGAWE